LRLRQKVQKVLRQRRLNTSTRRPWSSPDAYECRERAEREASPTAAIIDSQSVKSAEKGGLASTRTATMRAKVRLEGAHHQWRKVPSRELSIDLEADERGGRATGRTEAS
jgi:hypothetical protein